MNQREKEYFAALHADRMESADTFEKPSNRGYWRSVVEKYSDQAHFIYELIQNADDAGATNARFVLHPDKLVFAHNGTRHFTISNPANEEKDLQEGRLGDINSITGIAFSNKEKSEGNKIGKFGVGFKAVFQYTATPRIYDPSVSFRIDRFIVPSLLEGDYPGRRPEETLFIFPFDHKERNPAETYEDIKRKLQELRYPILFLSNLQHISYEFGETPGLYEKTVVENRSQESKDGTIVEKICLQQKHGEDIVAQNMWLFSRNLNGLKYSVGYFLDESNCLMPVTQPAYCYFPTKEATGLNFIIHAPFLLTDSREGIRSGVAYNNELVSLLAKLAADSLLIMRDFGIDEGARLIKDDILNVIPIREQDFCELDDTSKISFKPFYTEIKRVFETEIIIPTRDGYTSKNNAYWARVPFLAQLFNDKQLEAIVGKQHAKWVFLSLGRDNVSDTRKDLLEYIDSIVLTSLSDAHMIRGRFPFNYYSPYLAKEIVGITPNFTESQSVEWLCELYKWLSATSERTKLAKTVPIFLDQSSKAAEAFDEKGHMLLFLPSKDIPGCRTIREDLLQNEDATELIAKLGISTPSIRDEIFNNILPLYASNAEVDTDSHFRLFYKYYCQCPQSEVTGYIAEIRECAFVNYRTQEDPCIHQGKASDLYLPTTELTEYFQAKLTTKFISLSDYLSVLGSDAENSLKDFLIALGAKTQPRLLVENVDGYCNKSCEYFVDGLLESVDRVLNEKNINLSIQLWSALCRFYEQNLIVKALTKIKYSRPDGRYSFRTQKVNSVTHDALLTKNWLVNAKGEFVSSENVSLSMLHEGYTLSCDGATELIDFLKLAEHDEAHSAEDVSNLTESQREKVEFAERIKKLGIETEDDLRELEEYLRYKKAKTLESVEPSSSGSSGHPTDHLNMPAAVADTDNSLDTLDGPINRPLHRPISSVVKDILNRTNATLATHDDIMMADDFDEDEYTPLPVDYKKKADLEKDKTAKAIKRLEYLEELQQNAFDAAKYSYAWFKALLELEALHSNTNNQNSREVSISFARVEREPGTQRTLVLKQPNRYIPQFMEDLADIPLVLKFGDQTKNLAIEVANVKSYTLRVKLKSHVDISDLDFGKVTEAKIDAKSPVFLLEALRKEFGALEYEDDFDMQENLCENIEFVFGPPGTGKTTHLARNVLLPLMQGKEQPKVLVLTPTNKAADVLVRRIMDVMGEDTSYNDWLVRFGGTGDEIIEQSAVYRDKTFDIRQLEKSVTVTTIARFPYDFFMPQGDRLFIHGINWDYIVIDEASMIPLANIIFPLYKKTPKKFIIAGDPFQIEPITSGDLWKNENIYTLVHLDSFVDPHTIPHEYHVELLTTQYRSIPSVGTVFSKFAYGGILRHHRTEDSRKELNIDLGFPIRPLNIIKFPVSKYESIYRAKYLQHRSPYQVYSALFTFEYTVFFAKALAEANPNGFFRIGIIAPYRAQSDLIEKLVGSENIPEQVDIQVGTIHGFQGDECDIIFAVFNSPPYISDNPNMFLNKRNIINVSISRARDYLFVLMPDDRTENIKRLDRIKRVEQLIKNSGCFEETSSPEWEDVIFGSETYLEDNAFSTGHQNVNVYGLPERRYEVRSEDAAVDVQIHRQAPLVVESIAQTPSEHQIAKDAELDVEYVYSSQYGEGKIISRFISGGKTWITVQYADAQKGYDEALALAKNVIEKR